MPERGALAGDNGRVAGEFPVALSGLAAWQGTSGFRAVQEVDRQSRPHGPDRTCGRDHAATAGREAAARGCGRGRVARGWR